MLISTFKMSSVNDIIFDPLLYKSLSWESQIYPVYNYLHEEEVLAFEDILDYESLFRVPKIRHYNNEGNLVTKYSETMMYALGDTFKLDSPRTLSVTPSRSSRVINGDNIATHEIPTVIEVLKKRITKEFNILIERVLVEKFLSGPEIYPLKYISFKEIALFSFCSDSVVTLQPKDRSEQTITLNLKRGCGIFIKNSSLNKYNIVPKLWKNYNNKTPVILAFIQ